MVGEHLGHVHPAHGHSRCVRLASRRGLGPVSLGAGPRGCEQQRIAQIERLGGAVFVREGRVVEVNLNRAKISNLQLALVSKFAALTDLSLEATPIGDEGLAHLEADLPSCSG